MFKKELKNSTIRMGRSSILEEALVVYENLFDEEKFVILKDRYGRIGYEGKEIILVGKKEPYGDIVSVHKKIWDKAKKEKKDIVMYIKTSGYFYRFRPENIKDSVVNERVNKKTGKGIKMVNFDVRYGKNLMKIKAEREHVKLVVLKNKAKQILEEERLKNFSKNCL